MLLSILPFRRIPKKKLHKTEIHIDIGFLWRWARKISSSNAVKEISKIIKPQYFLTMEGPSCDVNGLSWYNWDK